MPAPLFDPILTGRPFGRWNMSVNDTTIPHVGAAWSAEEAHDLFDEFAHRYRTVSTDDGLVHVEVRKETGLLLSDLIFDQHTDAVTWIQLDHLSHLEYRGVGDPGNPHQAYVTRAEAVQKEIIEPLRAEKKAHDVEAIAARVLAGQAAGFQLAVDDDYFWRVAHAHEISPDAEDHSLPTSTKAGERRTAIHLHRKKRDVSYTYGAWDGFNYPAIDAIPVLMTVAQVIQAQSATGVTVRLCGDCRAAHSEAVRQHKAGEIPAVE